MPRPTSSPAPRASANASAAPEAGAVAALARELSGTFEQRLGPHAHVVLAVSGGVDSTALMHLANAWVRGRGGPMLSVATVDHGLRAGSAEEAAEVGRRATAIGLAQVTLTWEGDKPATGIQAAAREARYRLLARHLAERGATALATAHTEDDQAETVLMRLARGSGLDGLAGMAAQTELHGVTVLRPLLGVAKARLAAALTADGIGWIEDPSNERLEFERVRLRQARDALATAGLGAAALARSARRLARARGALEETVERAIGAGLGSGELTWSPLGYGEVAWPWLVSLPEEVRLRLLSRMIRLAGGQGAAPSLCALEGITIARDWRLPAGATLGGAQLRPHGAGRMLVCRELGRGQPAPKLISPGGRMVWDNRFEITAGPGLAAPVTIVALGAAGLAALRAQGAMVPNAPARVLWTLPAVLDGGRIVGVAAEGFEAIAGGTILGRPAAHLPGRPVSEQT